MLNLTTPGDYAKSCALHAEAADEAQAVGNWFWRVVNLNQLGLAKHRLGDVTAARQAANEIVELCKGRASRRAAYHANRLIGLVALSDGDYATARRMLESCLSQRGELGDRRRTAAIQISLGYVALGEFDPQRARGLFTESLRTAWELRDTTSTLAALEGMAMLAARDGLANRASQFAAAATAARAALGTQLSESEIAQLQRWRGSEHAGWAEDLQHLDDAPVSLEEAVELALRTPAAAPVAGLGPSDPQRSRPSGLRRSVGVRARRR